MVKTNLMPTVCQAMNGMMVIISNLHTCCDGADHMQLRHDGVGMGFRVCVCVSFHTATKAVPDCHG